MNKWKNKIFGRYIQKEKKDLKGEDQQLQQNISLKILKELTNF